MSRLIERLRRDIAGTPDPLRRAELRAELGCHLARVGDIADAQAVAAELRAEHGDGRSSRVAVRIMLLEGLILFFDNMDPASVDRVVRAHTVALAWRHDDLIRVTAAWHAHLRFVLGEFDAMGQALQACFDRPGACVEASLRVCTVLGNAHELAGDSAGARPWYDRARREAVDSGDGATIGALIFNRPAMALVGLRLAALRGRLDVETLRMTALGLESARAYCVGARHSALMQLLDACRARVAMLSGDALAALVILDELLARPELRFGFHADRLMLQVERAACLLALGRDGEAEDELLALDPAQHAQLTMEDALLFLEQHAALARALGLADRAAAWDGALAAAKERYDSEMGRLKAVLAGFSPARLAA